MSGNGQLVATASYDGRVILWDAKAAKPLRTLTGHNDAVYDLAFSPDDRLLATASGDVRNAQEIKTLLALGVPASWDLEGVLGGMSRAHERTEFRGISAVPPGCFAIARDGDVKIHTYWDWEFPTSGELGRDSRTEHELVDAFREVLVDAVEERLVADVEVASYLSGGIDSSVVVCLLAKAFGPERVFGDISFATNQPRRVVCIATIGDIVPIPESNL